MDKSAIDALSPQQLRCLRLVGQGKTTPEIAFELAIAEGTVNGHIAAGISKLGVANRRQAGYVVLSAAGLGTQQNLTGQNLSVDQIEFERSSNLPSVVRDVGNPSFSRGDDAAGRESENEDITQPFRTIVRIIGLIAALLIIILALKPLVESGREMANFVQPDKPH